MRFKVDENVPVEVRDWLNTAGHDAESVHDEGLTGTNDSTIASVAEHEGRAILTLDKGFGDIRLYDPSVLPGIILLRPSSQDKMTVLELVRKVASLLDTEELDGRLWIVQPDRIRIR